MIWFTSDTHGFHTNYTKGQTTWSNKNECRDYETVKEMTDAVINAINKYVKEDDILYDLGDWTFGGIDKIWEFRKRINCKTIHFIFGNHDNHIKKNKVLPNVWENIKGGYVDIIPTFNFRTVYAQDLFTSVQSYLELTINKKLIVLSHFPIEEWLEMDHGSIMLHGHCHHALDYTDSNMYYRRMDVGMDWEEFRPYTIDEIFEIMEQRKIKKHNS